MGLDNWIDVDKNLLLAFNGSGSVFVDGLVPVLTSGYTWIPFYVILFYLVVKNNERWSYILLIVSCVGLCLLFSGGLSDLLIKDRVARLRPICEPSLSGLVKVVKGYRAEGYGFFSSHASNTMSFAVFLFLLVRSKVLGISMILWSLANGWTRLYLGVHYPSDVVVGFVWGALVGAVVYLMFLFIYRKISPKLHYVSSRYTRTGYSLTDIDVVLNVLMLTLSYVMIKTVVIAV